MHAPPGAIELDRLATGQLGLVTFWQLLALGSTKRQVARWVADGRLFPVRRGVYRVAGVQTGWEAQALAGVLAGRGQVVASYRTAARLWGLSDTSRGAAIHVSGARVRLAGVRVHAQAVGPDERTRRICVPVTTVPRTLADLASVVEPARLGRMTDEALRLGILGLEQLRRYVDRQSVGVSGRRPAGAGILSDILADRLPGYDSGASAWERDMDRKWEEWGLPFAERQHVIRTPRGVYRPDRAIVEERIAVDWNGYEYHGMRSRFDADSDRRADLAAAGWWALDFTSKSSPERICETVHAVWMGRRSGRIG